MRAGKRPGSPALLYVRSRPSGRPVTESSPRRARTVAMIASTKPITEVRGVQRPQYGAHGTLIYCRFSDLPGRRRWLSTSVG